MWVWYCRPPIGAHFHPTPQPPPVLQQLGEKAHLRTVAAVLANAQAGAGASHLRSQKLHIVLWGLHVGLVL